MRLLNVEVWTEWAIPMENFSLAVSSVIAVLAGLKFQKFANYFIF